MSQKGIVQSVDLVAMIYYDVDSIWKSEN